MAETTSANTAPAASTDSSTGANQHALKHPWSFYFLRRQGARSQDSYEKNLKKVATFGTVEDFWAFYNHLVRPNDIGFPCDYHVFRSGIKPMWEDDANKNGGRYIFRVPKKKRTTSKHWEDLLLALIGEQFDCGDEITGIVVSMKYNEDLISVWNRESENNEAKRKIEETMRKIFGLPPGTILEYKAHAAAINSSNNPNPAE